MIAGLPHGCKPPPLAMQHPCNPPQKPRTMAAVSPLHQVVPPQPPPPPIPPYEGNNMGFSSTTRTSSFAAALRKLAKQAVDPVTGEKDLSHISPVSSPVLSQGPKQRSSSMFHQGAFASSSPPVVTIAPSRTVPTHTTESRKVMDLSTVNQVNSSGSLSNGHIQEPIPVKMDSSKGGSRSGHGEKWEESNISSKGMTSSSQVRPHATIAPLPRPDDSLTSSRGFQPYRGSEEGRSTLQHHLSLFDHHPTASYPYSPAFLPPPHLSHPAYRFDDPLFLERYSLLRPPVMPYPQPSLMGPPAFYPNSRYASDLIAQTLANTQLLNHERLKQEEERRLREKEHELDQARSKEQERQREKEQKEKEKREKAQREKDEKQEHAEQHKKDRSSSGHGSSGSKRTESPSVRTSSAAQSSTFYSASTTTTTASTPLNLVVEQQHKKEAELWVPWQQPGSHQAKEGSSGTQDSAKHPAFRQQDGQNHIPVKDNHLKEKTPPRFSPTHIAADKKYHGPLPVQPPTEPTASSKKHSTEPKKFDSIHHHLAELSGKDHEWRHEKLQKACTNSHRKNHETKKALSNHQRKAVNGAILKQQQQPPFQFQNEGMHARLLESEKCRIEQNGQVQQPKSAVTHAGVSQQQQPSLVYRPSVPPLVSKEATTVVPRSYVESYAPVVQAPVLKSSVELTPVVSKLDLEAKRLRNGDLNIYEDDAKEAIRLKNFLIITKGPPLKLNTSPQKLKFLKVLGLTTNYKRKKIELDMYLKRRKILYEDSIVEPLPPAEEKPDPGPLIEFSVQAERLAEQLRSETVPEKLEFFFQLGLTPITLVKKEERERIGRIVEDERSRRHYRMLANANKKASPRRLFVPKSEAAMRLDHLRKLREQNALFASSMYSKGSQEEDVFAEPAPPKPEQVPYLATQDTQDGPTESEGPRPFYRNGSKSFNKFSFKRGHSLKSEFRHNSMKLDWRKTTTDSLDQRTSTTALGVSVGTQVDSAFAAESSLAALRNSLNWPGLESIMEAFYRHQQDQSNEKLLLTERCNVLRKTQEDLKREADCLSQHMSEVLKCKKSLEEESFKYQCALERIKQCLHFGR